MKKKRKCFGANKEMRTAMVVFSHYPADARVRREAEALIAKGHTVDIVCLRKEGEGAYEKMKGGDVYRVNIQRKRGGLFRYLWEYFYFLAAAVLQMGALQVKKGYKIVHVHNMPDILILAGTIPKLLGAKLVLDIHDIMPEYYMRKFSKNEYHPMIFILKLCEKFSIFYADKVILASPFFKKRVDDRHACDGKTSTLLNLPDPAYFKAEGNVKKTRNGKFKLIYPGTISEIHGIDIALVALKTAIGKSEKNIEFHIFTMGAQREKEKLMGLVHELDLERAVFFHPRVPAEKLAETYHSMDIGVVPKRGGVFAEDAMSTKLFEFAAVGLPTIASKTKSDSLYFDDSMVAFFEPGNAEALSERLMQLIEEPALRVSLSHNAAQLYNKVNWDNEKERLTTLYSSLQDG